MNAKAPRDLVIGELSVQVRALSAPALRKLQRQAMRMYEESREEAAKNPGGAQVRELFASIWSTFYKETQRRDLLKAERADRGVVLFTVFQPTKFSWWEPEFTIRTPHRRIEHKSFSKEPYVYTTLPDTWEMDFARLMKAA